MERGKTNLFTVPSLAVLRHSGGMKPVPANPGAGIQVFWMPDLSGMTRCPKYCEKIKVMVLTGEIDFRGWSRSV